MTNQETFDIVVAHLRKQGRKCVDPDDDRTCLYRGPNGDKCAGGCLIPDEKYRPEMEGKRSDYRLIRDVLEVCGHDTKLVYRLQRIHDRREVGEWEREFQQLATEHNLIYTPPKEPPMTAEVTEAAKFTITSPGYYRTRDGLKVYAVACPSEIKSDWPIQGWFTTTGECGNWTADGRWVLLEQSRFDLIAPWSDAPAPKFQSGDKVRVRTSHPDWNVPALNPGSVVTVHDFRDTGIGGEIRIREMPGVWFPVDMFEPIAEPEPFRVDKPGVYEQRDGGEARVERLRSGDTIWGASGRSSLGITSCWTREGGWLADDSEHSFDLRRFLRPLDAPSAPQPEPVDGGKVEALAHDIFLASIAPAGEKTFFVSPTQCFDEAEAFYVEAAKGEVDHGHNNRNR